MTRAVRALVPLAAVALAVACAGNANVPSPSGGTAATASATAVPASNLAFASLSSAPVTLSGASQAVTLPSIPGVSGVGGSNGDSITMSGTTSGAVITVASTSSGSSGPPSGLQSSGRSTLAIGGVNVTPLYYVGVTSLNATPTQLTFSSFKLGVPNLPPNTSVALAHFDPSIPQNGWNQHCAFGPNQVSVNGNSATFTPNATLTTYFGAPIWFAVYQYPSGVTAQPTIPPATTGTAPTVSAPTSLTGTYIGSGTQTSPTAGSPQYLEFSLTQSGSSVSGPYAILPNGNQGGGFGTLSGTVSGSTVTLTATNSYGNTCTTTVKGTASGSLLSGTFASSAGTNCSGGGTFAVQLQTFTVPNIAGSYSGTIKDSVNGTGTVSMTVTQTGPFFSGVATANWPSNSQAGGSSQFVGFLSSATNAQWTLLPQGQFSCAPFGMITVSGTTLSATYTGSGTGNAGCNGTGTFSVTRQ